MYTVGIWAVLLIVFCSGALSGPVVDKEKLKDSKDNHTQVTGRASMLGRFEPIVNSVVVPFLVATGVVSLVRMVPSMVSSLPGVLGFAKRSGYEEVPKEFYDIMTMLDNAAIRYGQPIDQSHANRHAAASHPIPSEPIYPGYQYQQQLQAAQQNQQKQQQTVTGRQHQG